jgi:integrase
MAGKSNGRRDNRTGAIYKDGDGYRVQILLCYDPDSGKPIYKKVRAKTHDEAVDELKKLQFTDRLRPTAAPSGMTVAAYADLWLENHVQTVRAPKTYEQYCWVLKNHVTPTLGKKGIDQVKRQDVQSLVSAIAKQRVRSRAKAEKDKKAKQAKKEGTAPVKQEVEEKPRPLLSPRTVALAKTVLHAMYESAVRDGYASSNPVNHITLPTAKKKPAVFLTAEQVQELNKKLSASPAKELVRFMLATGTRIGEATGIRWKDLDLKVGFVRVSGQLQRLDGELQYRPTTKTNQDRTLPLLPWVVDELKSLSARQLVEGHSDPEGIVFLNEWGRRYDQKSVNAELSKACAAAKIPVISAHKLRHTAATLALMETGDMHGVQKMLGHQQIALTTNLYGHANAERLRPITDALGKAVKPTDAAPDAPDQGQPE